MKIDVITIFPEAFDVLHASKIFSRGLENKKFEFKTHDLRDYTDDKHRSVDDVGFGGGPGMVLKPEPAVKALESIAIEGQKVCRVYLTPQGRPWNHELAKEFLEFDQLILLCGRYQGIDQRIIDGWIDQEISIGDYILSGGEIPAMVVTETVVRFIPGVLGNEGSLLDETFVDGKTEWPLYTRPRNFRDMEVPSVLLSGDHAQISKWRANHRKTKKTK